MGTTSFWDRSHDINFIFWSLKSQVYSNVNKPKTKHFDFLQQHMPAISQGARRTSVTRAACWPYAMPHLSNTLLGLFFFFTVPRVPVVSGDTTSFAGFSSGTSGLGYLDARSFQKQDGGKSVLKVIQPTLEHLPARKEPTHAVRRPGFSRSYARSTWSWMLADFPLQKHSAEFLHLSTEPRVGSRLSTISE